MKFLIEKYLGMSEDDFKLNEKYKQGEIIERLDTAKTIKQQKEMGTQANPTEENGMPGEMDFGDSGGGGDFGGGGGDFSGGDEVFSGGDTGMGSGGSEIGEE